MAHRSGRGQAGRDGPARAHGGNGGRNHHRSDPAPLPRPDDIIIAVMGMTGSGKSSFIEQFRPARQAVVGHGLESCTRDVEAFCCEDARVGRFWLVDSPGWNDSHLDDAEVLGTLAAWLNRAYTSHIKLTGIIYLHSIHENRVQDSTARSFDWFRQLCGNDAFSKVRFVTSFWDQCPRLAAENRERELKSSMYWGEMIQRGAEVSRHDNTPESAHAIVRELLLTRTNKDRGIYLNIQREMAEGIRLDQTTVGQNIGSYGRRQRDYFQGEMDRLERKLHDRLRQLTDEHRAELREERRGHEADLNRLQQDHVRLQADINTLDRRVGELQIEREEEARLADEEARLQRDVRRLDQRQEEILSNERRRRVLESNLQRAEQIRRNYESCTPQ